MMLSLPSLTLLLMMLLSTHSRMCIDEVVDGAVVALTQALADDYLDVPTFVLLLL
jgi:hypothetical protein